MIYLCKPCGLISTMCGSACDGVKNCMNNSCSACGDGCRGLCNIFTPITHFPLAFYVMGSWGTMIGVIALSAMALTDTAVTDHASSFCLGNLVLGVIHFIAARYVQWRVVAKIQEEMGESAENKDIPHGTIAQAASHIALYDIGFCLYFFVFVGSFGFNCWGITGDVSGAGWGAGCIMIMYGMGVWNYFFCWYCMQTCCGKKEKRQAAAAGGAPQQVGMPLA